MLAASSHDRKNDPESDHITVSIDVHTAFLHADVDQDLFAEPPEPDEWYDAGLKEDDVWKLNKAQYGYCKAPKLWHQHLVSVLESLNYHPLLTDPSCFRNDETNTNIFVHVDDGLMFGPKSEVLKLVELLSKQVLMRITGSMEKTGDNIYFLGQSDPANSMRILGGSYIRNVINVLGWKTAVHVPGANRRHVQREGNSKKNYVSNRERPDESEAYSEILGRRSECKEPDRNHYTFEVRERVYRQRLGRASNNMQKHKWRSGETQHSQHGHEHSKTVSLSSAEAEFFALTDWGLPKEW